MTRKPKTVQQAMELAIQHLVTPDGEQLSAASSLEAYLEHLPPAFAAALREELAKGTLQVSLVPGSTEIRVAVPRPRSRRPKAPAQS